jgi:polysaccharide biosynthesis protein PslG
LLRTFNLPAASRPGSLARGRRTFLKGAGAAAGLLASPLGGRGIARAEGEELLPPVEGEMPVPAEGTPAEIPAAPVEPAPVYPPAGFAYGFQAHLYYQNVPKSLDLVRDAGFGWVKQQVRWSAVEIAPGAYDWTQLDGIVGYSALMGIRVLLSVVTAPAWSRAKGGVDGPPDDLSTFGSFLTALATRYAGKVHAYEIWNEQNFAREWGGGRIQGGEYVELLKVAYPAIKAADPNASVISGALTPTGFNDPNIAIDDVLYLRQMYEYQGGIFKTVCDAVGAHAGGFNNPPGDSPTQKTVTSTAFKNHKSFFFKRVEDLREVMVLAGDSQKKMWLTEFGWSTANQAPGYEYGRDVTEFDQANWLVQAFQLGRGWGWIDGMFVWNLNFQQIVPAADEKFPFGIVRPDGTPRLAYTQLKFMAKPLR